VDSTHGWERNKARTRLALATAAVRLFRENGFEGTTVDDIAAAAGTSRRTFFRYFGTKEEVLFLDIRPILDELHVSLATPAAGMSRWAQVRAAITESVERIAAAGDEIGQVSIMSWLHEPAVSRRFAEYSDELETVMRAALADDFEGHADRDLRAQLAAKLVTATYMSAFAVYLEHGGELPAILVEAFDLVEDGLVPGG
jgi:AcrR family transcriptional regulator